MLINIPTVQTPEASSLGIFGEIPVSTYTGVPEIQIPITELSAGNINLPVFLQYHSGGIKAYDVASWVGLGWALNAGGVITRSTRGCPDFQYYIPTSGSFSYLYSGVGGDLYNQQNWEYPRNLHTDSEFLRLTEPCISKTEDLEPDIYYYNFAGKSGQFTLLPKNITNNDFRGVTLDYSKLKIVPPVQGNPQWEITDTDGTVYIFSVYEENKEIFDLESSVSNQNGLILSHSSSFYLSKIESAVSDFEINFNYSDPVDYYTVSRSSNLDYTKALFEDIWDVTISHKRTQVLKRNLESIETSTHILEFIADGNRLDAPYQNVQVSSGSTDKILEKQGHKLDKIILRDKNSNEIIKEWDLNFEYFNDHVPASLETHFTKPDGDSVSLFKRLKLTSVDFLDSEGEGVLSYSFDYHEPADEFLFKKFNRSTETFQSTGVYVSFPPYLDVSRVPSTPNSLLFNTPAIDHWGYFNGDFENNLANIPYLDYSQIEPGYAKEWGGLAVNREPDGEAMKVGVLTKITYPTGGYTEFEFEANEYKWINNIKQMSNNTVGGGLRIKKIKTYESPANDPIIKNYIYENGTTSTGILVDQPQYLEPTMDRGGCFDAANLISTSLTPLASTSGGLIGYEQVSIEYGNINEFGKEIFNYYGSTPKSHPNTIVRGAVDMLEYAGEDSLWYINSNKNYYETYMANSPFDDNFRFDKLAFGSRSRVDNRRGKLQEKLVYHETGDLLRKEIYEYTTPDSITSARGLSVFTPYCEYTQPSPGDPGSWVPPVFWLEYEDKVEWSYMKKKEVFTYGDNPSDAMHTTQRFVYDSNHLQLLEKIETNSADEVRVTEYKYAHETYDGTDEMKDRNMLTQPYSVTIKDGSGQVQSKNWTIWKDWGSGQWLPCGQWVWNGGSLSPSLNCSSN
ncbi:MAG: hypothetical protein CL666_01295 [Balneola sp.]|nr:hypothetical protein [Balneola sp.]